MKTDPTPEQIDWKDVAERAAGHIECLLLYATSFPRDSHPRDANTFLVQLRGELGKKKPHRTQSQFGEDGLFIPFSRLPLQTPDTQGEVSQEDAWRDYTSAPLGFDGGLISINRDGSGYFCVNENEADWDTDDEDGKTYIVAKFSAGEAQEIRDHLNKYFPVAALSNQREEERERCARIADNLNAGVVAWHIRNPPVGDEGDG